MTDLSPDDDQGPGIELDRHGDPLPQGTRMIEHESYERVIEGLKIAAGAYMHLAARGATREDVEQCRGLALRLDQCRRICMQKAGIEDPLRASPTEQVRGAPLSYTQARARLLEGLMNAAGGARQLATCFRGELWWSEVARQLEAWELKIKTPQRRSPFLRREAMAADGFAGPRLILPAGHTRH